jgi:hypothetical protein
MEYIYIVSMGSLVCSDVIMLDILRGYRVVESKMCGGVSQRDNSVIFLPVTQHTNTVTCPLNVPLQ